MSITNKTWSAGLISLALVSATPIWADEVTADTVVATVNGQEITLGHMIVARTTLPQQYQQLEPSVLWDGVLEQLVQQTALAASLDGKITKATEISIANQTSGLLAGEALGKIVQDAVTEDTIKAAYDEKYADAAPEKEFNAAHILVETEEDAVAIKADLDGGADFAETAKEKSTGPSGPSGGDLGWFGAGMMVPEFEAAVMAMEPGQISDPVKTQFGWHLVSLVEVRDAAAPALEEVREELFNELQAGIVETAIAEIMSKTDVENSGVEIDPTLLGNLDLIAN